MKSKHLFSGRQGLLGMVKPEITKIDPKDPNVVSELTNRDLFKASTRQSSDADVDVNNNATTGTLFSNSIIGSNDNIVESNKLHGLVLDYCTKMGNAINLIKRSESRIFDVLKFASEVEDHLDRLLLFTVAYLSEHLREFGKGLSKYFEVAGKLIERLDAWTRNAARWVHWSSEASREAYIDAIDSANEIADELIVSAENYVDVPYVDEAKGIDLAPGTESAKEGEANS